MTGKKGKNKKAKSLGGQQTADVSSPKKNPWDGVCCEACYNATGKRCTCRCGGAFHGLGQRNGSLEDTKFSHDPILSLAQSKPFVEQITDWNCLCGESLKGVPIQYYPHSAGWKIHGISVRVWLYKTCPKCHYQMNLQKMGVPRDA